MSERKNNVLVSADDFLTIEQCRYEVPAVGGKAPGYTTIRKWIFTGVCGHKLRAHRVGVRLIVRRSDLVAFLEAIRPKAMTSAVCQPWQEGLMFCRHCGQPQKFDDSLECFQGCELEVEPLHATGAA